MKGFALNIVDALEYIQEMEKIHCDVKMANILIQLTNGEFQATLGDFGLMGERGGTPGPF
jgi:serine/threonine protein kinase